MRRCLAVLAAALAAGPAASCGRGPEIRYLPQGGARGAGLFTAGPLAAGEPGTPTPGDLDFEQGARLFALHVEPAPGQELPAVAGTYRIDGDRLLFEPEFPLVPGMRYRAVLWPESAAAVTREVVLPAPDRTPTTQVAAVYPSADVLPENLLKFYLHFSAPMSRGQAWTHLRILRASGEPVDMPFLELDEELWDRSGHRLTAYIDPGRIKREVKPLEDLGPAVVAGEVFVLEVLSGWEDAQGKPLRAGHRKSFRAGPPDREPIDPARWAITAPPAGGREPLVVALGEPLDHALLHDTVGVEGPDGRRVEGEIRVADGERTWSFTPTQAWADGEHQLVVATILEDLAGNAVGRPFEVDVTGPVRRRIEVGAVRVPFRTRAVGAGSVGQSPEGAAGR